LWGGVVGLGAARPRLRTSVCVGHIGNYDLSTDPLQRLSKTETAYDNRDISENEPISASGTKYPFSLSRL
jgi:hypothetical protein